MNKLTGLPRKDIYVSQIAPEGYAVSLSAPALVSEAVWEAAQDRMTANRGKISGNPRRVRMLSGRIFCPCGHKATFRGSGTRPNGRTDPDNYQCSVARNSQMWEAAEANCSLELFRVSVSEAAVVRAFLSAANQPESLRDARAVFQARRLQAARRGHSNQHGESPLLDEMRQEIAKLDKALAELAQDDILAVHAQMAGMKVGASPDAYSAVFAELAARRKDMEDRRGQLTRRLAQCGEDKTNEEAMGRSPKQADLKQADLKQADQKYIAPEAMEAKALEEAALVLSAPDVPGETKRRIIGLVIEKVVCQKNGADVYFLPGFGVGNNQTLQETSHSEQTLDWLGV